MYIHRKHVHVAISVCVFLTFCSAHRDLTFSKRRFFAVCDRIFVVDHRHLATMGKKNKDKKGKGKEKTEQKTERKAAKRAKKELAEKGEVRLF